MKPVNTLQCYLQLPMFFLFSNCFLLWSKFFKSYSVLCSPPGYIVNILYFKRQNLTLLRGICSLVVSHPESCKSFSAESEMDAAVNLKEKDSTESEKDAAINLNLKQMLHWFQSEANKQRKYLSSSTSFPSFLKGPCIIWSFDCDKVPLLAFRLRFWCCPLVGPSRGGNGCMTCATSIKSCCGFYHHKYHTTVPKPCPFLPHS